MDQVIALADTRRLPCLGSAVEAFFADKQLAANSRRVYHQALDGLADDLGRDMPISELTSSMVRQVLTHRWGKAAPATWNTRITAFQSFVSYCRRNDWLDHDPLAPIALRRVPRDQTKAIHYDDLAALWSRRDIGLREKTLWRMLYETAARANEILSLDVTDLDLGRKRAVIIGKGGHREIVVWASGTARLLARYLAGRPRGPVFLTIHQPNVIPSQKDRCPDTGRGRLSYERAWALFKKASGGWTLHQLRHSSLTHLGETGASAILLQAKSRHRDPRTLARYTHPSIEAVAELTTRFDQTRHPQHSGAHR